MAKTQFRSDLSQVLMPWRKRIAESVVREAYFQQGVPEEFKPESIRVCFGATNSCGGLTMGIMERENGNLTSCSGIRRGSASLAEAGALRGAPNRQHY